HGHPRHERRGRGHPARGPHLPDDAGAGRHARSRDRGGSRASPPSPAHEPHSRVSEGTARHRGIPPCLPPRRRLMNTVGNSGRFVEIARLGKTYATPTGPAEIVRDFTLNVGEGEFVCIVGHSGCGKSTVLSIVMGLNQPTTGGVVIGGREVAGPGTDRGVVFQSATLLPWLSVRNNVRLALDQVRSGKSAETYLDAVGLGGRGDQFPRELSAGMQQRGGIARAFALEPRLLLL